MTSAVGSAIRSIGALPAYIRRYDYRVEGASYYYDGNYLNCFDGPSDLSYRIQFRGRGIVSWVEFGSQYWIDDPSSYLMVISSGRYPLIPGSVVQENR